MKMKYLLSLLLVLPFLATVTYGGEVEEAKARMAERLPAINKLKLNKDVGENFRGYLDVRNKDLKDRTVVDEENADRKIVYEAIAKKTGTTVEVVGMQRAAQISARSAVGILRQNALGIWSE